MGLGDDDLSLGSRRCLICGRVYFFLFSFFLFLILVFDAMRYIVI